MKICCMQNNIAVRLIGCVGFLASLVVMTQLAAEMSGQDGSCRVALVLGLDSDEYLDHKEGMDYMKEKSAGIHIGFLIFSVIYIISSALLIIASVIMKGWLSVPWLLCELGSILSLLFGLVNHHSHKADVEDWVIFMAVFNIVVTSYFWIVVLLATLDWIARDRDLADLEGGPMQRPAAVKCVPQAPPLEEIEMKRIYLSVE